MTRRLRAAALVLLLLLGVGACGGGDDGESAEPQPTVTVTETVDGSATPEASESTESTGPTDPTDPAPTVDVDPDVDLSVPPTTYDEALAHVAAAEGTVQDLSRFETPDGIYCVLDDDVLPAGCELASGSIDAPDVCGTGGPTQAVGRIEIVDGVAVPVCNTDTVREAGAPTLDVTGLAVSSATGVACVVEEPGVTCIDAASALGFFLGAGRYAVFAA